MRLARVLLTVLLVGALPGAADAAPPDLSDDGLDRGALLALPAIYRVTVTVQARAIQTDDGERIPLPEDARRLREVGTAFGVAPKGYVVTARHVVVPSSRTLALPFYQAKLASEDRAHPQQAARDFVRDSGARAVGLRVLGIELRQADAGAGGRSSLTFRVDPSTVRSVEDTDLALLRIRAPSAPTLPLLDEREPGTPVVSIGFGSRGAFAEQGRGQLVPALRRGTIGQTRLQRRQQRVMTEISADVEPGDSGGPAVDSRGRVRGVVLIRLTGGGAIEPVSSVVSLLARSDLTGGESPASAAFRTGMERFWRLDFGSARTAFDETLLAFPDHTLAGAQRDRAEALQRADFGLVAPSRRRGALTALGVTSALAALACAVALARLRRRAPATVG